MMRGPVASEEAAGSQEAVDLRESTHYHYSSDSQKAHRARHLGRQQGRGF
jgi:hypothetical protein